MTDSLANRIYLTVNEQQTTGLSIELRTIWNVWAVRKNRLVD
jgi:hypothetical protein